MNEKISFQQLSELLSEITGSSVATSELFIKEFFAVISDALTKGETVKIKCLGTFSPSGMPDKPVIYAPDEELAEAINMPFACFEAVELNDDISDDALNECNDEHQNKPYNTDVEQKNELSSTAEEFDIVETTEEGQNNTETPITEIAKIEQESASDSVDEVVTKIDETQEAREPIISEEVLDEAEDEGERKSLLWLWICISLIIGLFIGYLIGNIYPYDTTKTNKNEVAKDIPLLCDSIATDSIIETADTIATPIVITDTIGKTRFLTTMARQYYGEMSFWVYIYEENKDILGNPNRIKPGTTVIIPDAKKYGIDKNDSLCVEHAKLKAIEIYAPYQK